MKLVLYGVNYAPELTGIGKYSGEMAEWLVKQGHQVRVVTAPPYYPAWEVGTEYSTFGYSRENINGVEVFRCPLYVPNKPSGLKRIIHLVSFALSSLPVILRQVLWKPDVVMVIEPPLFCAPAAVLVSSLSGAKSWLHAQDFEVDVAFDLGIIPFAWMKSFVSRLERRLMRQFHTVSTISQFMLQRLQEKGVSKPVLFPNWSDLAQMKYDELGRNSFRAKLGIATDQCLCLYSGNIAVKQGLEVLLDVALQLPEYQFVICGDGASKHDLHVRMEEQGLKNMTFLPLQPLDSLAAMLSAADIHLVIQKAGAADLVLPSKITNIFAVGGAAIVTAKSDTALGQLAYGEEACVYRCEPDSAEELVDAIIRLNTNHDLLHGLKAKAKIYASNYLHKEKVLRQLEAEMRELIS